MSRKKNLDLFETDADRVPGCHFFTGMWKDTCQAGVKYADVTIEHAPINGFIGSKPCLPGYAQVPVSCSCFRVSTPEEIALREYQTREAMRKLNRGISICCDAKLEEVGGGWFACSACDERVLHVYQGSRYA